MTQERIPGLAIAFGQERPTCCVECSAKSSDFVVHSGSLKLPFILRRNLKIMPNPQKLYNRNN